MERTSKLQLQKAFLLRTFNRGKRILMGRQGNDGIVFKLLVYALLISIGFVYLYPILYLVSQSFKSLSDLLDPTVLWLPQKLYLENFTQAWHVLDYMDTFWNSVLNSVVPAIGQTVSCAVVGYGIAKFHFPGKSIVLGLMMITFIVPSQVVMIPLYLMFNEYHMLGSSLPFIVPTIFAQGIKGVLFILIYTQFFRTIPASLEEAAQMDGAGFIRTFFTVILPISTPAIVVVLLFSTVWHWNETYLTSLYLGESMTTLPLQLKTFNDSFTKLYGGGAAVGGGQTKNINESIRMAGTLLIVLPLLILYMFAQRRFVEVVDKTGITGE
ncbi:carbohydrate ABC transporter permease [Paenibacillus lignilyticus]|uniref:Carbohydrate ABC transporter permease n=1 Tax=Paenibacillus lignilyticus TaxID=1172615 RepID=A0ABS5C6Z5_9BACL|nr:carbohydrate ABC transporter permease [Paenibacillus lignilyticus]MBP3961729.1 carbohydrate ABC transporter permease [Paenibacillus lignilyticus]MBP3963600.1 carbohydrate ABC transporter permease [Paenibacillus lignilyticus]